jgi:guanylate kinase
MPSISCTTRARRATEASGKCYDFVTEAEFDAMAARGEFLEYARVFGKHSYGTPKKWLEESRKKGLDLVLEIDVQGAAQVKEKLPESMAIFILPPSREELEGCELAVRIPMRRLRGGWPRHGTRLPCSANTTIIAW